MSASERTISRPEQHDGSTQDHSGGERQTGQGQDQQDQKQGRTLAEWVSLGISAFIVFGLVGVLTYLQFTGGDEPLDLQVNFKLDQVRQGEQLYYLPVEITNRGGSTGENVLVQVSNLDQQGRQETAEVNIDFLAANATQESTVAFTRDPRQGRVQVSSIGYLDP